MIKTINKFVLTILIILSITSMHINAATNEHENIQNNVTVKNANSSQTDAVAKRQTAKQTNASKTEITMKIYNVKKQLYINQYNRFKVVVADTENTVKIKNYRVVTSNVNVVKVSNGLLTRGIGVGRANITVTVNLTNGKSISRIFRMKVVNQIKTVKKVTGYRIVSKNANVWVKPYYQGVRNRKSKEANKIQKYMVKIKKQATIINGKTYYLVALPGTGKAIGWVGSTSLSSSGQFWRNTTGGRYFNVKRVKKLNIAVSVAKQRVYFRSGKKVIYTMMASTGKISTPTVRGHFKLMSGGKYFWSGNGGAKYWRAFAAGGYYFHSIPTLSANGAYGAIFGNQLGHRTSHGCIRLSVADAKWFYTNMPNGTPVYVY